MTVIKSCTINIDAMLLDIGRGERLRYTVNLPHGQCEYTLDEHPTRATLFDSVSCPPPCTKSWPRIPGDLPSIDDITHTLSMQFRSPATLTYRVERLRAEVSVETLIDCQYASDRSSDNEFEALSIRVVR
jgi:hypothetical protein